MAEPLTLRYRPSAFTEMVGQRLNAVVLSRMVEQQAVPTGLMFSGPSGTGKTTAARILAYSLDPDADPGLSVIEVDAASNGGVADVRALTESLRYSTGGNWRVVILDEGHSLTRDAFNALLKTLEEPPPGTVFVLVTTEPHKIPETVASRLLEFEFRRVGPNDIFDRLVFIARAEGLDVELALLQRLAQDADGSVRRAVMDLERAALAGLTTAADWTAAVSVKDFSSRILTLLYQAQIPEAYALVDQALAVVGHPAVIVEQLTRCLRDLLVLRAGGTLPDTGEGLDQRRALASHLEAERVMAAIKILWDLKTKIRPADDPRGSLDLAVALIGEVFLRGRAVPMVQVAAPTVPAPESAETPAPQSEPRRLTLADLKT